MEFAGYHIIQQRFSIHDSCEVCTALWLRWEQKICKHFRFFENCFRPGSGKIWWENLRSNSEHRYTILGLKVKSLEQPLGVGWVVRVMFCTFTQKALLDVRCSSGQVVIGGWVQMASKWLWSKYGSFEKWTVGIRGSGSTEAVGYRAQYHSQWRSRFKNPSFL